MIIADSRAWALKALSSGHTCLMLRVNYNSGEMEVLYTLSVVAKEAEADGHAMPEYTYLAQRVVKHTRFQVSSIVAIKS